MLAAKLIMIQKDTSEYDENLTYDNTNIEASFPNANNTNIDSTGNVLIATAPNGEAISIVKSQDGGETDFVGLNSEVVPFHGKYEFANISDATSSADTLITATPIQDGDNIVIAKDNDSINKIVASGVVDNSINTVNVNDVFGDNSIVATYQFNNSIESLSGTVDGTGTLSTYETGLFGNAGVFSATFGEMNLPFSDSTVLAVSLWFKQSSTSETIYILGYSGSGVPTTRVYIAADHISTEFYDAFVQIPNTLSNDVWHNIIIQHDNIDTATTYIDKQLVATATASKVLSGEDFSFGQLRDDFGSGENTIIDQARFFNRSLIQEEIDFLYTENRPQYQLDTTPATAGETPSRVYSVDADYSVAISGGFESAVKDTDTYTLSGTGASTVLLDTRAYNNMVDNNGSQTLQSKVTLKAIGDKMTELTASISKKG